MMGYRLADGDSTSLHLLLLLRDTETGQTAVFSAVRN